MGHKINMNTTRNNSQPLVGNLNIDIIMLFNQMISNIIMERPKDSVVNLLKLDGCSTVFTRTK